MSRSDKTLALVYAALALVALIGTQVALVRHLLDGGTLVTFVTDLFVNAATTFITIDVLVAAAAALVLMVVEARRIGLPRVWIYVVLTFVVAISVAFPAFLCARQVHLARTSA